jgi:hypothetical protein
MPCFLVPIHEFNTCHNPEGEGGGQFCSTAGEQAHIVPYGVMLPALAQMGHENSRVFTRRFLFNPDTEKTLVGVASGREGRDQSHAEAHDLAVAETVPVNRRALDYDHWSVHGHFLADNPARQAPPGYKGSMFEKGPLAIQIDRLASNEPAEQFDALHRFLVWAVSRGATRETKLWSRAQNLTFNGQPLGKAYPDLFPKAKRVRAPRKKAA